MTMRAELLQMAPRQVFECALKDGLGRARKFQGFGIKKDAVDKWYKGRPEYNNPEIKRMMQIGNEEAGKEALAEIRDALESIELKGTVGPVGIIGFSDKGMGFARL